MTLGETEVIHINIGTREDDWHLLSSRRIFPVLERHINKTVRHTLEEEFAIQNVHAVYTHLGIYLIFSRGEFSYLLYKLLVADFIDFRTGEGIGTAADGISHTYLLAHDEVVGFHETVLLSEDRQHVFIKLKAEKNDEHTEEISEGKARKLRYADMLTQ